MQRHGTNIGVHFQVADVHRPMIAVRDLTAMGCNVEFSETGAHNPTAGRRWKLEPEGGQFLLTVDSLHDVSKNWQHNESSPLEVSLAPEAASHARLPDEQDRKKHEPDLLIEIRAPQVKRGPRDPTDDEVIRHALVTYHVGIGVTCASLHVGRTTSPSGEAKQRSVISSVGLLFLSEQA